MPHIMILGKHADPGIARNDYVPHEKRTCPKCKQEVEVRVPVDLKDREIAIRHLQEAYGAVEQQCPNHDNAITFVTVGVP